MAFGDDDLSVFFQDMGEAVTTGAGTFLALVDIASADLDDGTGLVVIGKTVLLTYSSLDPVGATLARGTSLTVRGSAYLVAKVTVKDDGRLSQAYLEAA